MTPTEKLRALVRDRMTTKCPHCGEVSRMTLRAAAAEIGGGTNQSILHRFLNGAEITSGTFDRLSAWVESPHLNKHHK